MNDDGRLGNALTAQQGATATVMCERGETRGGEGTTTFSSSLVFSRMLDLCSSLSDGCMSLDNIISDTV